MMARLMIDSAVLWARDYRIDSFRFDLMGHQPREAMERLQQARERRRRPPHPPDRRRLELRRGGQRRAFRAGQPAGLNGTGIGTFSDRGRDAVRGGGCCDDAARLVLERQGWLNGLFYAPNGAGRRGHRGRPAPPPTWCAWAWPAPCAATAAHARRQRQALEEIDYAGQPAGYAPSPTRW
jgi:pullulanase